ncbi:MAG TPA: thiamine pyrophosphate-dependent dehydrogenase E1 component subunit alpha [Noviherbaspirillum sp.]|nr:thiamine pyrophosphate-dependent dehydrogenase E1 component subunit alpha [Noviherbaspirillum sp.]HJV84568.1 thiamine pyrophosphate-dependent dehydrogenase E1 component subunit alpha [Noviherbaspirillum sp.]
MTTELKIGRDKAAAATSKQKSGLSREQLLKAYRQMKVIREFEDRVNTECLTGAIPGFTHLYSGQEAVAVGACEHMNDADYIISTHRGHGHCIAKGCDVVGMMKELHARRDGLNGGKGGSMHIADVGKGMLGANGIVGAGSPIALGAAIACKLRGEGRIAASFVGDGASNQGTVFEAMNMAVVLKAPKVFVFENNGYSEHTGASYGIGCDDVVKRIEGFGIPVFQADGFDFFSVYEAMGKALAISRNGGGPSAIYCTTIRYFGHFVGDPQNYRAKDEVQRFREQSCCLQNFRKRMAQSGELDAASLDAIDREVGALIERAVTEARNAPRPQPEDLLKNVYDNY